MVEHVILMLLDSSIAISFSSHLISPSYIIHTTQQCNVFCQVETKPVAASFTVKIKWGTALLALKRYLIRSIKKRRKTLIEIKSLALHGKKYLIESLVFPLVIKVFLLKFKAKCRNQHHLHVDSCSICD